MDLTRRSSLLLAGALALTPSLSMARAAGRASDDDEDDGPANVFISPCGQPFRAKRGAPYPVVDWFKQADANADGKLDRAEFDADAAAFFKKIDLNGDGFLSPYEVAIYEHRVAPEILGYRVKVSLWDRRSRQGPEARLWLAQMPSPMNPQTPSYEPQGTGIDRPGEIDPGGGLPPEATKPKGLDESGKGASPYSLFDEPEPVMAADLSFSGIVSKANFLKLAGIHFSTLDRNSDGFLTLAGLPMTPVQQQLAKKSKKSA